MLNQQDCCNTNDVCHRGGSGIKYVRTNLRHYVDSSGIFNQARNQWNTGVNCSSYDPITDGYVVPNKI